MANNFEFNIREFNMSQVGDNRIVIFIGKRGSGKSKAVMDYLYNNQDLPMGTCISPTEEYNNTFTGKIPSIFLHEEYSQELLQKFIHRQKVISKRIKTDPKYKSVDPRAFLIFDDCLYDAKNWINDRNIRFIFMNGRHVYITFLLTMQYLLGIPPSLRDNVDFIFIFKETKISTKRKLYEYYAGMFPTFEMFSKVLDECTKDHGCLVIDNRTQSDKLEDQVYWYRADVNKVNNFRMCDEAFWKKQPKTQLYIDKNDTLEHNVDYNKIMKPSKYNINVNKLNQGGNNGQGNRSGNNHNPNYNYDPKFEYRY